MTVKKVASVIVIFLFLASFVFAEGVQVQKSVYSSSESQVANQTRIREETRVMEANQSLQLGLQNALDKVESPVARQRIQANIDGFQLLMQSRFKNVEQVKVSGVNETSGEVKIMAKENVKLFGLIPFQATKSFVLSGSGVIVEKGPWYSFVYSEIR